jgi:flagellar protein FliO/FliZ
VITKRVFGFLIIIFFISSAWIFSEDSSADSEETNVPPTISEEAEGDSDNEYDIVDEETLTILDTEDQAVVERSTTLNTFTVWDFVRMLLVLGGVLAFIYLIFFILKKVGNPKIVSDSTIKVLSTQNLESGRSLHLIEIGPQVFLIGSGESSVQLISEITDKETLDTIKLDQSVRNDDNKTFTNTFLGFFKRGNDEGNRPDSVQVNFLKKQRERLKKM